MSTAALLGTLAALVLTIALSLTFVAIGNFSGLVSEEASYLRISGGFVDLRGLLLAGIVIGALGALDDMTVTQASTVWELFRANPQTSRHDLYRAGLRVGRDHVASTVNTLFLAYAGASLPLLLLFVATNQSAGNVANGEIVAVEIVRALVGSIGLVAAVPITTWLAAVTVTHRPEMPAAAVPPSPPSRFRRPFSSPAERELWEDNRSHADHTFWADHHPHDHPADHEHHLGEDPQSHAQHEVWDTHQDHHSHHDDHDQGHDDAHDDFDLGDENDYH
jgi:hypothetical protein